MLYHARKLRSVLGVDAEYALRRASYGLVPAQTPAVDALFHCCVHKTGSQWVRLLLSDPRFYRQTGLMPYFGPSLKLNDAEKRVPVKSGSVVTSLYIDKPTLLGIEKPANWRAFFVTRDPRDLLISRYFSARFSHRVMGSMDELRTTMEGLSDDDGILYILANKFDDMAKRLASFADQAADNRITMVKFEDLTSENGLETWLTMFNSLGIEIPEKTMANLLSFYSLNRLRPPKSVGDRNQKYRSGKRGEWRSYFNSTIADEFEKRYGNLVGQLNYQ